MISVSFDDVFLAIGRLVGGILDQSHERRLSI